MLLQPHSNMPVVQVRVTGPLHVQPMSRDHIVTSPLHSHYVQAPRVCLYSTASSYDLDLWVQARLQRGGGLSRICPRGSMSTDNPQMSAPHPRQCGMISADAVRTWLSNSIILRMRCGHNDKVADAVRTWI